MYRSDCTSLVFAKGCENMLKKLGIAVPVLLCVMAFTGYLLIKGSIPDEVNVVRGKKQEKFSLNLPRVEQRTVEAGSREKSNIPEGEVKISCSLLGVIPIKDIHVNLVEEKQVIPGGEAIGIYMKTRGILVVGSGTVSGMDGLDYEPALDVVQSGDYINSVNGVPVKSKEELMELVNKSGGEELVLDVQRNGEATSLKLSPVRTGKEEYKLGIWVRDDTQGIGTLTYIDKEKHFGALGHGISDIDTGGLLALSGGTLYHTDILSVTKGERGVPGELSGVIRYREEEKLGDIGENTEEGIFGTVNGQMEEIAAAAAPVEIAYKQEVEEGPAVILCAVDGTVREYQAEIEKIYLNSQDANKSMVIRVTDPKLLERTGGIVQGMSGSPDPSKWKADRGSDPCIHSGCHQRLWDIY